MKLNVPVIGQRNPQWANIKLGTSDNTIGADGCVITSVTMLMQYYKHTIDVATLNNWLILNEGYVDEDFLIWDSIQKLANDIDFIGVINCGSVPAPIDKINQEIQAGHPVIIGVDFNHNPHATEADHFLIIIGIMDDGTYIVNDPWYSDQIFLTGRYAVNGMSQAEAILEVIFYEGSSIDFIDESKPSSPPQQNQVGSEVVTVVPPTAPEPTQPVEVTPEPVQTISITDDTTKITAVTPEIPSNSPSTPKVDELSVLFTDLQTLITKILKILLIKTLS